MKFEEKIQPFSFVKEKERYFLNLSEMDYKQNIFQTINSNNAKGCKYNWEMLSKVIIESTLKHIKNDIELKCESDRFCAISKSEEALKEFAIELKNICAHDAAIQYYLSEIKIN